ncbi:hypothetical protein [Desulfogranum mediterraneum]|uniref:hypothetical protein n=1 Tax=Desulfogranum mediterraneum TaxID=160661 RepID=UPI000420727B|nr:hypothetical protein [Desulfogranum mediterraneum]
MFKPGVKRSVHLFAAPFLWTGIGAMLMVRGYGWLEPGHRLSYLSIALLLGSAKSLLILDKTAGKSLGRIVAFQDGTCLGAVYSWKTWLLVGVMMSCGILMRAFVTPGPLIGAVYCAIGWALCLSSRLGWRAWFRAVHPRVP